MDTVVNINQPCDSQQQSGSTSLTQFLYHLYTSFSLATESLTTFLGPRDEQLILQLALQNFIDKEVTSEDMHQLWIEVCHLRLGLTKTFSNPITTEILESIDIQLTSSNIIDRVHLLKAIVYEFPINAALRQSILNTTYLVNSPELSWFEFQVIKFLLNVKPNKIEFLFSEQSGNITMPELQRCKIVKDRFIEPEPITRALLAYLAIAVNIKNSIDLALIINKPSRSFGRTFFSTLRLVAKQTSILPGQLVMSYPACLTDCWATSSVNEGRLLRPFAASLRHLADTLRECQDALSGFSDEENPAFSLATTASYSCMSPQVASAAVESCLKSAAKAFSKPSPPAPMQQKGVSKPPPDPLWSIAAVKRARNQLTMRLDALIQQQKAETILAQTPDRPSTAGGSIQGRAAFKLACFFLVTEANRQLAPSKTMQNLRLKTISNTPQSCQKMSAGSMFGQPTPISQRLLAFFVSPDSAHRTPQPIIKQKRGDLVINDTNSQDSSLPSHPVHARFQSNLDWADSPSPVSLSRFPTTISSENTMNASNTAFCVSTMCDVSVNPSISTHYCQSMPTAHPNAFSAASRTKSPDKKPRRLFNDVNYDEDVVSPVKRPLQKEKNTKSFIDIPVKKRNHDPIKSVVGKRRIPAKEKLVCPHQRSMLSFFKPKEQC